MDDSLFRPGLSADGALGARLIWRFSVTAMRAVTVMGDGH